MEVARDVSQVLQSYLQGLSCRDLEPRQGHQGLCWAYLGQSGPIRPFLEVPRFLKVGSLGTLEVL